MKSERVIFGTWGICGEFGANDPKEVSKVFEYAYERGIRTFDTAYVYGKGASEEMIGEFAKRKNDINIATKIPANRKPDLLSDSPGTIDDFYPFSEVLKMIERSRDRLGRISVLQLHNWHPSWNGKSSKIIDRLYRMKEAGDIDSVGVSIPNGMDREIQEGFDVVQVPINLLERWAEERIKNSTSEIWARSIFCHGALAGSLNLPLTPDDARKDKFTKNIRHAVGKLEQELAHGVNLKNAAIDYVANLDSVAKLIIGFRTRRHIDEILER